MKKLLSIALMAGLGFASCKKESRNSDFDNENSGTITLEEAVIRFQNSENKTISRSATKASFLTHPSPKLINFDLSKPHAVNPNNPCLFSKGSIIYDYGAELSGSHGRVESGSGSSMTFEVKRDANGRYGSGINIKYPFLRGKLYTIVSRMGSSMPGEPSQTNSSFGDFHFGLANAGFGQLDCMTNVPQRPISPNDRLHIQNSVGTSTFSFSTPGSFSYLDLNAVPTNSVVINGGGKVYLSNLSLREETAVDLHSSTPNFDPTNGTTFYFMSRDNLIVGENFTWSVTGNLQIVGSSVGSHVLIKSTTPTDFKGEIIAKLNGSYDFYRASLSKCVEFSNAKINGPSETGFGQNLQFNGGASGSTTFQWTVQGLPEGSTISGLNNQNLNVTIPSKNSNHPNSGYFTLNLRTTNSCGYSLNVTKHVNYSHFGSGPGDDVGPEG